MLALVQRASRSLSWRAIGHAPSDVFDRTVCVTRVVGSWVLRKETPASQPSNITAWPDPWSQNPRPYRIDAVGTSLWARTISATQSVDTIRPSNSADHRRWISAAVE